MPDAHQDRERQKSSQDVAPGGDVRLIGGKPDGNAREFRCGNHLAVPEAELASRRSDEEKKGSKAYIPTDRNRQISKALKAYALFAASADKGAVRQLD